MATTRYTRHESHNMSLFTPTDLDTGLAQLK